MCLRPALCRGVRCAFQPGIIVAMRRIAWSSGLTNFKAQIVPKPQTELVSLSRSVKALQKSSRQGGEVKRCRPKRAPLSPIDHSPKAHIAVPYLFNSPRVERSQFSNRCRDQQPSNRLPFWRDVCLPTQLKSAAQQAPIEAAGPACIDAALLRKSHETSGRRPSTPQRTSLFRNGSRRFSLI